VTAASWVKESDSGDWYLYLATPLVGEDGATTPAYHRVNSVIREMQPEGFGMDPFEIKLIGTHDPIAKDLVAHRAPRPAVLRYRRTAGSRFGELAVEEAFIYPRPPTPEEAVGMQLWDCGGLELNPGIGLRGRCHVVIIELDNQRVLAGSDRTYRGTMEDPTSLRQGEEEVTWAEGGAVRIVAAGNGSAGTQRWVWSQLSKAWEQGGCPPDRVLHAVLAAME